MFQNFFNFFMPYFALFFSNDYDFDNKNSKLPLVIATWGNDKMQFQSSVQKAWESLKVGNSRLGSLVTGLSECERLQCDYTVGWGGSPDERGETTLDSMIMDGPTHNVGAVAALRRIKHSASVAWAVMNYTKHTLLVGEKATQFALSMGFEENSLNSSESQEMRTKWLNKKCQPNFWKNVKPNPEQNCGPYKPTKNNFKLNHIATNLQDRTNHDTIGMIIVDKNKDISAGTSTNGVIFKIPGRVGDSPIPGSGAYVDNDIGAAVATGDGDIIMRFSSSFLVVELMRQGNSPSQAAKEAVNRIKRFYPNFFGAIVAATRNGEYGAACSGINKFKFSVNNAPLNSNGSTFLEVIDCI